MTNKKICHLTTAHPRHDVRIFEKECVSLAEQVEYQVSLIVADGKGFEKAKGVSIHDIGLKKGRFNRFFIQPYRMLKYAYTIKADLYHFHDPELIFTGFILRVIGKKVIYDVHEDIPKSLMGREWLPKWILKIIAFIFKLIEDSLSRSFSGIITATPAIENRLLKINKSTICIQNYSEISTVAKPSSNFGKKNDICYTGAISQIRGIIPLLDALYYCNENIYMHLAGSFIDSQIEEKVKNHPNFSRVKFYGQIKREELQSIYKQSFAGLVPFLPYPNHIEAQPNKFFEYMAEGLPVLCSNFPLWKSIVEKENVGLCFNPEDPKSIGESIQALYTSRVKANEMGQRGVNLVKDKYNWAVEEEKLLDFYKEILFA